MMAFSVRLDHDSSFNVLPSRGSLATYDVLPPGHGQLLQCLSIAGAEDGSRMAASTRFQADMVSPAFHSPEVGESIHATVAIAGARQQAMRANVGNFLGGLGIRFM